MQTKLLLPAAVATLLLASTSSCSKMGALSPDNFTVTPAPLEAVGGQVPVTINGRFPEKYMKRKATVTVTPVLRYEGGEAKGQAAAFQGEKVMGNDREISYKLGGSYTMKSSFAYVPEMQRSDLYLTFDARVGNKVVDVPEVKVGTGVLATSDLVRRTALGSPSALGEDAFQYAIAQSKQAQIKYLINQAKVRTSELQSVSVQDFVKTLREIKADQKGFQLDGIEVSAYASPDGKFDFNKRLAEQRQGSSQGYLQGELKKMKFEAPVDGNYTAEDWDGFRELVAASNLQDKDVIIRVLSMYDDPEQREVQIRNLSAGYTELADEILPELRRARLTLNYNIIGRSDEEIQSQLRSDASQLSVEELLYAATLTDNAAEKETIYRTAAQQYPADYRALNNLGTLAYARGDVKAAQDWYAKANTVKSNTPEVAANLALASLAEGNTANASALLAGATQAKSYNDVLGNVRLAEGNYAAAAQALAGSKSNSAALAQLLNKDYSAAAATLSGIAAPDATTDYLRAVLAARTNQGSDAVSALRKAIAADPSLKARAAKDLEFLTLFNDSDFLSAVR